MSASELALISSDNARGFNIPEPSEHDETTEVDHPWEDVESPPIEFEEDIFALVISELTRDFQLWEGGEGPLGLRLSRFVTAFGLLFAVVFTQFFVLYNVKMFVTARSVHNIRDTYDHYEVWMYGNNVSNMDITPNGKHRGRPEFFNESLFDSMPHELKERACRIPLSQPYFFAIIIYIWSVVCVAELLKTSTRFQCLVLRTKTATSMKHAFETQWCGTRTLL